MLSQFKSSTKLSKTELNGFYVNLDSNYDIFSDDPEYGVYFFKSTLKLYFKPIWNKYFK